MSLLLMALAKHFNREGIGVELLRSEGDTTGSLARPEIRLHATEQVMFTYLGRAQTIFRPREWRIGRLYIGWGRRR